MESRIASCMLWLTMACGPAVGGGPEAESDDGGGSSESTGVPAPVPGLCDDAEDLVQPGPSGLPSGFQECSDGFVHRVQAVDCDPGGFVDGDCRNTWEAPGECMSDGECTDGGVCLDSGVPWDGCSCSYGCSSDDDCGADEACFCDGAHSQCIPAQCRSTADCGAGQLCGVELVVGVCGTVGRKLSCTRPEDECRVDAECDECLQCIRPFGSEQRSCSPETGICGPCG